jgi:DNA-binding phage protein
MTSKDRTICHILHDMARDKGITHSVISRLTGLKRQAVTRALSGKANITHDTLKLIADAIAVEIIIKS